MRTLVVKKVLPAIGLFFVCSVAAQIASAGETTEAIFERAKTYSVKIQTNTEVPFSGDSKGTSIGAGFVVDKSRRWIVTNAHVTSRSPSLIRVSSYGKEYENARPVYIDPYFDIAIIEAPNVSILSEAPLDCGKAPAVGTAVGAFGHPWDFSYTGTKGIISGRTSDLPSMFGDYLQTDAPINPGNSGGPLIDLNTGKIVGINSAGRDQAQNMNYAIPIEEVCTIVGLLRKGIDPTPVESPFSFFKDSEGKNTMRVAQINSNGKALGVQVGDVITAVGLDSKEVQNEPQMLDALRGLGGTARLTLLRDGRSIRVAGAMVPMEPVLAKRAIFLSGMVIGLWHNQEFVEALGIDTVVTVEYVEAGSVAQSRNIAAADLVQSINGKKVRNLEDVYAILQLAELSGGDIKISFKRVEGSKNHFYSFRDREMPLTNLKWIFFEEAPGAGSTLDLPMVNAGNAAPKH